MGWTWTFGPYCKYEERKKVKVLKSEQEVKRYNRNGKVNEKYKGRLKDWQTAREGKKRKI